MKKLESSIEHKIRFTRLYLGITGEELAALCYVCPRLVSHWEMGATKPDQQARIAIAKAFGLTLDEFEFGELAYITPELVNA